MFSTSLSAQEVTGLEVTDLKDFDDEMYLTRGTYSPLNDWASWHVNEDAACTFTVNFWGWTRETCEIIDAMILLPSPGIDTLLIEKAYSDGYVKYDDWDSSDRNKYIEKLWKDLQESTNIQNVNLVNKLELIRWIVPPELNKEKNYIYYVYLLKDEYSEVAVTVSALLDREGYIKFSMLPIDGSLNKDSNPNEFRKSIEAVLDLYTPYKSNSYEDYAIGDKVSEYGVFGVFAALAGLKWGKVLVTGFLATLLIFIKKFSFLIFIPFLLVANKFFKKRPQEDEDI